jgi:3-oxoadipate enol-lactonase
VPTLVLGGRYDSAVTPEDSRALAAAIPGARYEELDAAHISNWEQRDRFTQLVLEFLRS